MSRVMFDITAEQASLIMRDDREAFAAIVPVLGLAGLTAHEPHVAAGDKIVLRCQELRVMIPGVILSLDIPGEQIKVVV